MRLNLATLLIVSATLITAVFSNDTHAARYDFHPDSRIYMGGGFDPANPSHGFATCVESTDPERVNGSGVIGTKVSIKVVRSETEIHREVGFSTQIAATYLFMNGHSSIKYAHENSFNSDSLTFLIVAQSDYGREAIRIPRLTTEMTALPLAQLRSYCGPEIVTEQTKGVMLFGVFTIKNLKNEDKSRFDFSLGGGASLPFASADVQSRFQQVITSASSIAQMEMSVHAVGGPGVVSFSELLNSNGQDITSSILNAPKVMKDYILEMTYEASVPTSFTTMTLEQIAGQNAPTLNLLDNYRLTRLYDHYLNVINTISKLEKILYYEDPTYNKPTNEQRVALLDNLDAYANSRDLIEAQARSCLDPNQVRGTCTLNTILRTLPQVEWPEKVVTAPAGGGGTILPVTMDPESFVIKDFLERNPSEPVTRHSINLNMHRLRHEFGGNQEKFKQWFVDLRAGRNRFNPFDPNPSEFFYCADLNCTDSSHLRP